MKLNEMAVGYRKTAKKAKERAAELRDKLTEMSRQNVSALEIQRVNRRIKICLSIARECNATASMLEHYYDG